jgi:TyrR family helix-turn-helix protein
MNCVRRISVAGLRRRDGIGSEEAMEGSLDDITSRFERSVLTQLYRSYPTRKLAKRLGVSHTAIAISCVSMV